MSTADELQARIDAIEESYEFFLAYAAQGLASDQRSKSGGQLRQFLGQMESGLAGLGAELGTVVSEAGSEPVAAWADLVDVVTRDANAALAAVTLVAARPEISSQLIDNLNANIHLRALLTDLFLVDELIDG